MGLQFDQINQRHQFRDSILFASRGRTSEGLQFRAHQDHLPSVECRVVVFIDISKHRHFESVRQSTERIERPMQARSNQLTGVVFHFHTQRQMTHILILPQVQVITEI